MKPDMKTDIEIARSIKMRKITEIAEEIGIPADQDKFLPYFY
mgnify:CR=1 FL=1